MIERCVDLLIFITLVLTLTSCDQKKLGYPDSGFRYYIELRVTYDKIWHIVYPGGPDWAQLWDEDEYLMSYESLMPAEPEGLRVVAYHADSKEVYDYFNLDPYGGIIDLNAGTYFLTNFNNDTEYIIFHDMKIAAEARATTRQRSRMTSTGSTYNSSDAFTTTINPPDMLYACYVGPTICNNLTENIVIESEMRPLVYKYLVRYHFTGGLQHLSMASGSLDGMAASVFLNDGHTAEDKASIMYDMDLDNCMVKYDGTTGSGLIYAVVNTFGVPGYPNEYYSRADANYGLTLETLLTNGHGLVFNLDITSQMEKQPRGGVIDVYGLEITDKDAAAATGAFDVDVDDWGPHEEMDIMK